jgi:tetratricopeptide (TPR) repeat protein
VLQGEQGQVDAQLGLAVIAHARGNDAAARRGYRQVLESVPDHPRAWAGLAELAGEDDAGGIESRLRQLLANRPSGPLHFALGNVLARQERWSDAQQEYFAAATLAPDAPDYAYNVAVALERIGKSASAQPWYARALQQAATGRAVRFDTAAARARLAQLQAAPP